MAATLTTYANILKVKYLPPIREQVNQSSVLLSRIDKVSNGYSVSGKTFTVPLHTSRNASAGSGRAEGGATPTAGNQGFGAAVIPMKYLYAACSFTGPALYATRDNAGAFATAMDTEIQGAVRDLKKAMNRQLHGDGRDALAFWTAADNTTAASVDDGRGNNFVRLGIGATTCDVIDATDHSTVLGNSIALTLGGTAAAGYTVAWSAGTISGTADTDYAVLEDTLGYQMMGIDGIIDDGNPPLLAGGLHGITIAADPSWVAQVVDNSGTNRALTLALMQSGLDAISTNSDYSESDVEFGLCSYGVRAKYIDQLVADKRHVNTTTLDGGFKGLDFNGIPIVPDPDCRKNVLYWIVPKTLKIFRLGDIDWMTKDGGAILSRTAGYDKYDATLFQYGDLGTIARNACAKVDDLTE